jgi:hypothetical protein
MLPREILEYICKIKKYTFESMKPFERCPECERQVIECWCEEPVHTNLFAVGCQDCARIVFYTPEEDPPECTRYCFQCKEDYVIDEEGDMIEMSEYKRRVKAYRKRQKQKYLLLKYEAYVPPLKLDGEEIHSSNSPEERSPSS